MIASLFSIYSWADAFPGIEPSFTKEGESITSQANRIVYTSPGGIWVKNCEFLNFASSEDGGAIKSESATHLFLEASLFTNVVSSLNGGAVYYKNTESGQCVFERVCSYSCKSSNSDYSIGQFCFVLVKDVDSVKNILDGSSAVHSDPSGSNPCHTVYLCNGNISLCRDNVSINKCNYQSAFVVCPSISSSPDTEAKEKCSVSFSSITNNTANGNTCMWFDKKKVNKDMLQCNVISNTAESYIFYVNGYLNILGSSIINNNAAVVFQSFLENGVSINMSTIDDWSCNTGLKYSPYQDASFIVAVDLLKTAECDAQYDSWESLIPSYVQTPNKIRRTVHMKRKFDRLLKFRFIIFILCH